MTIVLAGRKPFEELLSESRVRENFKHGLMRGRWKRRHHRSPISATTLLYELTDPRCFALICDSKTKQRGEGIPANERNVNRSTRQKISGREQRPGVVAGGRQRKADTGSSA